MKLTWNAALEESEMVMYETVHKLFKQTGFTADDVRSLFVSLLWESQPSQHRGCITCFAWC